MSPIRLRTRVRRSIEEGMRLRVLLYRAFLDTSNGGYYSPIHKSLKCATLIPPSILPLTPERLRRIPPWLNPYKVIDPCTGKHMINYLPSDKKWVLHNDPRLDLGFLTDKPMARGGRIPWGVIKGSVVVFVSGLIDYPEGFWETPRRFAEIRHLFREAMSDCRAALYAVGGMIVDNFIDILDLGWKRAIDRHPCLKESPNYWYQDPEVIAILGKPFRLRPPVKLYTYCNWKATQALIELLGSETSEKVLRNELKRMNLFEVQDPLEILERYAKVEIFENKCIE